MMTGYQPVLNRRTTLKWLSAATAWSGMPGSVLASVITPGGYGSDPVLNKDGHGPWPRLLDARQLAALALLGDLILPATPNEPAPSAVGIAEFIDEWVSAPYPAQMKDRTLIIDGLARLEKQANAQFQAGLLETERANLAHLLDAAAAEAAPDFFQRLRFLVVGGYYTTDIGFKAIGYMGNVPLAAYPGVTDDVRVVLEAELQALGL